MSAQSQRGSSFCPGKRTHGFPNSTPRPSRSGLPNPVPGDLPSCRLISRSARSLVVKWGVLCLGQSENQQGGRSPGTGVDSPKLKLCTCLNSYITRDCNFQQTIMMFSRVYRVYCLLAAMCSKHKNNYTSLMNEYTSTIILRHSKSFSLRLLSVSCKNPKCGFYFHLSWTTDFDFVELKKIDSAWSCVWTFNKR